MSGAVSENRWRIKITSNLLSKLFIVILLFIGIYEPVVTSFSLRHFIGFYSIAFIAIRYKYISKVFSTVFIVRLFGMFALIALYIMVVTLCNDNALWVAEIQNVHMIIYIIPFCLMIATKCKKAGIDQRDFMTLLVWVAMIQAMIILLSLFWGSMHDVLIDLYLKYADENIYSILNNYRYRLYGFSSNMTSYSSYFQAFAAIICIYRAIEKTYKYYFPALILGLTALLNTRTSAILLIVGIIMCAVLLNKSKVIWRMTIFLILTGALSSIVVVVFQKTNSAGYEWWITEINKITNTIETGDTSRGFIAYFVNPDTWEVPENTLQFMFGTGIRVMGGSRYGARTDVGFINDIWYGGIFYTVILYLSIFKLMKNTAFKKTVSNENKNLLWIMYILLLVSNLKGMSFKINDCYTTFFVMLCYCRMIAVNESNNTTMNGDKINGYTP